MIFADTGFFIALASPGDHLHDRPVAWALQLAEKVVVTEYVLFEAMNAMSRQALRPKSTQLADQITNDPLFVFVAG
jgi:predicted nucleic acid-binding protein